MGIGFFQIFNNYRILVSENQSFNKFATKLI